MQAKILGVAVKYFGISLAVNAAHLREARKNAPGARVIGNGCLDI